MSVLSNAMPMVEISTAEYGFLTRESEKIAVIKRRLAQPNCYMPMAELKAILDFEDKPEDTEDVK